MSITIVTIMIIIIYLTNQNTLNIYETMNTEDEEEETSSLKVNQNIATALRDIDIIKYPLIPRNSLTFLS